MAQFSFVALFFLLSVAYVISAPPTNTKAPTVDHSDQDVENLQPAEAKKAKRGIYGGGFGYGFGHYPSFYPYGHYGYGYGHYPYYSLGYGLHGYGYGGHYLW